MTRNAFNFGGTVSGVTKGDSKDMLSVTNPSITTEAGQFQSFINQYFNTIVPSNGGKWSSNESTQNNVNMQLVDQQLAYAQSHNMQVRMHNLLWGQTQQPSWVNSLINSALSGDTTAKTNLSNAITSRINYYAGTNGNRSQKYTQVDGLNEGLHSPTYWTIYGASGIANIYNQLLTAAAAAGNLFAHGDQRIQRASILPCHADAADHELRYRRHVESQCHRLRQRSLCKLLSQRSGGD